MFLGTAITGDYSKPMAFQSLEDFKSVCGSRSPEGSITYEYVAGLLSAGLPVLFRRIARQNQDTVSDLDYTGPRAQRAELIVKHHDIESDTDISDIKITEKWGGTFGNDMNITIRNTGTAIWIDVYLKYTLLEKHKIVTIKNTDTPLELNKKIINALNTSEFERINIEVLNTDPVKFQLQSILNVYLTGGTDFDEILVANEIPASYNYIKDKILFQPKFITSGGYTDTDMGSASPIATAMLNLTLERQDCRALIDLPIGTPAEEQQSLAEYVAYQQLSDSQPIPSASICAPWQYMQVGSSQLWLPPSYAYLTVVGSDLSKGRSVYTPKAGLVNGQVANIIRPEFEIGSDLSEQWQADGEVNINPIMRLQSGNYVIAGNSTLLKLDNTGEEQNAFIESSSDLAVIEIRRFVYNLASELRYQYNGVTAFETFSLKAAKFFECMKSERTIVDYSIINKNTDSEPRTLKIDIDVSLSPTIKNIEINLNVAYGSIEMSMGGEE